MKTLVIQSSADSAPPWVRTCLVSARQWAQTKKYDYRFTGDRIFDVVPDWYLEKTSDRKPVATDYARLVLIRQALEEEGYDQAIWLDADVIVLDQAMQLEFEGSCAFGQEVWVQHDRNGKLAARKNVHNAVCVFRKNCPVLPFLIHTVQSLVKRVDPEYIAPQFVGPKLLKALHPFADFALLPQVGALSPLVVDDVLAGGNEALELMYSQSLVKPQAFNCCASMLKAKDAEKLISAMHQLNIRN